MVSGKPLEDAGKVGEDCERRHQCSAHDNFAHSALAGGDVAILRWG